MLIGDSEWLGDEYASLAPLVRAGLGILLARGSWTWWHHPGAASTIMLDAVAASGVVTWGGDPAVLLAREWLDVNTAVAVARAFESTVARRGGELRIKIQRQVYSWGAISTIDKIRDDLALAFERQRTFVEWPTDRRPRQNSKRLNSKIEIVVTGPPELHETASTLVKSLPHSHWIENSRAADFALGSIDQLLTLRCSAEVVIILERASDEVIGYLDSLRSVTGAQCAILLPCAQPQIDVWLTRFASALTMHQAIDDALMFANLGVKIKAEILASTQVFILQSKRYILSRTVERLGRASADGTFAPTSDSVKSIRRKEPQHNLEIQAVRMESALPVVRVLNGTVTHNEYIIEVFPVSGLIYIDINIIPITPLHFKTPRFPDDNVQWKEDSATLQVHMLEIERQPVTESIQVPRSGNSTTAIFKYRVESNSDIDLRFMVSDGVRILQTARIQGRSGSTINFFVESIHNPIEQKKEPFDVALLVNNSLGNRPSATVLTSEGVHLTSLESHDIAATRDQLREILESSVICPDSPLDDVLFQLANQGKMLFDGLKQYTRGWPEQIDRVQLTTHTDAYFPLEYLYDGEIPDNEDAGLCGERSVCLNNGFPKQNCTIKSTAQQLCPMGFLGVTAIIERQTWDKNMEKTVWLSRAKDLAQRQQITDLHRIAFAASNNANNFCEDDLSSEFNHVRINDIEVTTGTRQLTWHAWKNRIETIRPNLLVLIPHIENSSLYIGDHEVLAFGGVKRGHIGDGEPVVIAIGCNSAVGTAPISGLPAVLMRKGAKVVIAALTGVLGRYANIATSDITAQLIETSSGKVPVSIGELLTHLRRQFLAKDNPLGLVLIAFGDADYILGETAL